MIQRSVLSRVTLCALLVTPLIACGTSATGGTTVADAGDDAASHAPIFVQGVLANSVPACVVTASASAPLLPSGLLDLGFSSGYVAPLLIGSNLPSPTDAGTDRVEANVFEVTGADVTLRDTSGNTILVYGATLTSTGPIPPAADGATTYGYVGFDLVPAQVTQQGSVPALLQAAGPTMALTLEVTFQIYGSTLAGQNIVAPPFTFEVKTCYGCSVSFAKAGPPASTSAGLPATTCFGNQSNVQSIDMDFCAVGQDRLGEVPCADCQGTAACTLCKVDADCAASGVTNAHCVTALGVCASN